MTWSPVATLPVKDAWQLTPPVEGQLFRLRSIGTGEFAIAIRQAQTIDQTEFWDFQRFIVREQFFTLCRFDPPEFFTQRRLALKAVNRVGSLIRTVEIEVSDMPLSNPATVTVNFPVSSTVTPTPVNAAATNTPLLAANSNRKGATIWNESTATLFIELGGTASLTAYTAQVLGGGYYEVPYGYTGAIAGIWSAANGKALVREFT